MNTVIVKNQHIWDLFQCLPLNLQLNSALNVYIDTNVLIMAQYGMEIWLIYN